MYFGVSLIDCGTSKYSLKLIKMNDWLLGDIQFKNIYCKDHPNNFWQLILKVLSSWGNFSVMCPLTRYLMCRVCFYAIWHYNLSHEFKSVCCCDKKCCTTFSPLVGCACVTCHCDNSVNEVRATLPYDAILIGYLLQQHVAVSSCVVYHVCDFFIGTCCIDKLWWRDVSCDRT